MTSVPVLTSLLPAGPVMKVNAAIALLALSAASFVARRTSRHGKRARIAVPALVGLAVAIAAATFSEQVTGVSLGIDQLIVRDLSHSVGAPGRMAVATAISLLLLGAGILALDSGRRGVRASEWLAVGVALLATLALIGDLFGVVQLTGLAGYSRMGANTAIALVSLAIAVVGARPQHAIWKAVAGSDGRATFLRRFGPVGLAVPFLLGAIVLAAGRAGVFSFDFAVSLGTFFAMGVAVLGLIGTAAYIRRAEAEGMGRREAEVYRLIVETANEGVWTTDQAGLTLFMNQRMLEMLGYEGVELIGKPALNLTPTDVRERQRSRMKERFSGSKEAYETSFVRKDGSILWALVGAAPRLDEAGKPAGSLALVTDVTVRRAAEESVRQSELRFRTLFEQASLGIGLADSDGRLIECNPQLYMITGYEPDQLVGMTFDTLTNPLGGGEGADLLRAVARGDIEAGDVRKLLRRKDGSSVEVRVTVTRLADSQRGWLALALVQDLSEEVRAYKAIRESEEKSRFLSTMSHELRTPLNSILGFAQLIEAGTDLPLSPRNRRYVANIRASGEHLLAIVSEVLNLSRATSGTLTMEIESVSLDDVLGECMVTIEPLAKGRRLSVFNEASAGLVVHADAVRLKQCLLNVLSNAVKFTEHGSITIRTESEDEWVVIEVQDTGIGIETDKLEAVFGEFYQVDMGPSRLVGGTGLGLPLTRQLMGLMGGTVTAESVIGMGSIFSLRVRTNGRTSPGSLAAGIEE